MDSHRKHSYSNEKNQPIMSRGKRMLLLATENNNEKNLPIMSRGKRMLFLATGSYPNNTPRKIVKADELKPTVMNVDDIDLDSKEKNDNEEAIDLDKICYKYTVVPIKEKNDNEKAIDLDKIICDKIYTVVPPKEKTDNEEAIDLDKICDKYAVVPPKEKSDNEKAIDLDKICDKIYTVVPPKEKTDNEEAAVIKYAQNNPDKDLYYLDEDFLYLDENLNLNEDTKIIKNTLNNINITPDDENNLKGEVDYYDDTDVGLFAEINNLLAEVQTLTNDATDETEVQDLAADNNDDCLTAGRRRRSRKSESTRWKRDENKRKRERGLQYEGLQRNPDGKWNYKVLRPAKQMKSFCNCKISLKSKQFNCRLISEETRLKIFNNFWKKMSWNERKVYVRGLIDIDIPKDFKNRREQGASRRSQSLKFYLHFGNIKRARVCKKFFLNTLGITDFVVLEWLKPSFHNLEQPLETQSKDDVILPTARYRKKTTRNDDKMSNLKSFFENLPKLPSHYCRKDTKKLYLEPIFQKKTEVYELYVNFCQQESKSPASLKTFYTEFDNQSLALFSPRKDQCDLCVGHKSGNIPEPDYRNHIVEKDEARKEKEIDSSYQGSDTTVLTMDLQAVLLCPKLKASSMYYKMKLVLHNFTIYNNITHDGYCYAWHEGEGGVTANEFASLICNFIENEVKPKPNQTIVLWSDSCGYQNKNNTLANAFIDLTSKLNITVIQKFLVKGHTQMQCDSMHACIERKLQNKDIFVPADYVNAFKQARKNPRPYQVTYLDHTFFKNYSGLNYFSSIRPGNKTGDPTVSQLRCIRYTPDGKINYKLRFTEEWRELAKRRANRKSTSTSIEPLYKDRLPIKNDKFKHLQEIKPLIPNDYYSFYDNLKH